MFFSQIHTIDMKSKEVDTRQGTCIQRNKVILKKKNHCPLWEVFYDNIRFFKPQVRHLKLMASLGVAGSAW